MPRPERSAPPGQAQGGMPTQNVSGGVPGGGVREDIRALNSSILLLTQKMKYLVRNEKILGRNLIVLNKKIKTIEDKVSMNQTISQQTGGASGEELAGAKQKLDLMSAQLEDMRSRTATKEELKELKYIINSINPLEFATLSQVKDLVDRRIQEKGK
ncbi:MAG: hypothetical protein AABW59_00525 [archaeon]